MAFFNNKKNDSQKPQKAHLHKFLAKMAQFSQGKISWDELIAWIESKSNKTELYAYLRAGLAAMLEKIKQIKDPKEQERYMPVLEWILATQQGGKPQAQTPAQEGEGEPADTVTADAEPAANTEEEPATTEEA